MPDWPDVVFIDGGQGQLNAVREVIAELELPREVTFIGIAKGEERDAGREKFFMEGKDAFMLPHRDPVLYFVQRLRDEAHRFAIGTHRARRKKDIVKNPLDEIEGIGPTRKRALLQHFGSAKAVSRASLADLAAIPGISSAMAQLVYDHFNRQRLVKPDAAPSARRRWGRPSRKRFTHDQFMRRAALRRGNILGTPHHENSRRSALASPSPPSPRLRGRRHLLAARIGDHADRGRVLRRPDGRQRSMFGRYFYVDQGHRHPAARGTPPTRSRSALSKKCPCDEALNNCPHTPRTSRPQSRRSAPHGSSRSPAIGETLDGRVDRIGGRKLRRSSLTLYRHATRSIRAAGDVASPISPAACSTRARP